VKVGQKRGGGIVSTNLHAGAGLDGSEEVAVVQRVTWRVRQDRYGGVN